MVYEPRSVVCHVEGATFGVDAFSGVKRQQEVNREVFRLKWETELLNHRPNDLSLARVSSWRCAAGEGPRNRRPNSYARPGRSLAANVRATPDPCRAWIRCHIVPYNGADIPPYSAALPDLGIEFLPEQTNLAPLLQQLSPDLRVAILSRPMPSWPCLPLIRELSPNTKIIYDTVGLHFPREQRRAEAEGDPDVLARSQLHHYLELTLARGADATWVVSEIDRDVLLSEDPSLHVYVVPTIHPEEHSGRPFAQREGLLFVGNLLHSPNADAVRWLLEDILPLLRQRLPGVLTSIVGSHPPDEMRVLARDDVRVLDWVPKLDHLYEHARVFVAPLRFGTGMKVKIGESLAHGLPVVTTDLGAESMGLVNERDVLIANTAEAIAGIVARCYRDEKLWTRVAISGRRTIVRRYAPSTVRGLLAKCLTELGVTTGP